MGTLFDLTCRRPIFPYDPELYCKRLGQNCDICHNSLTHEKCISLCKCYVFCHQPCFLSQFEPAISNQDSDIRCNVCKEYLNLHLEAQYTYSPQKTTKNIVSLVLAIVFLLLSIISIILTLSSSMASQISFILLYLQGLALGIGLYFLALKVRQFLYKKAVKVREIISTKLEIQTSAFKELDIDTNEELTKDYLTFQSKKERV